MAALTAHRRAIGCAAALVVNRAVLLPGNTNGLLSTPGGFTLGASWRIKSRLRRNQAGPKYVLSFGTNDTTAIIYGYVANTYEILVGGSIRMALSAALTDTLFHTLEVTFAAGTVTGFFDGVQFSQQTGKTSEVVNYLGLKLFAADYDNVLFESAGTALVMADFNEPSGNGTNAGTLGGSFTFNDGGVRENL